MKGPAAPRLGLPHSPDNALLIAMLFLKLGGSLHIDQDGRRAKTIPCRGLFCDDQPIPQFPDARPHEGFLSAEQWEGAMRMVGYLLCRLHPADTDFAYAAFATVMTPQDVESARARLQRGSDND